MTFDNQLDKVALIDYLTVSFYDFNIKQVGRNEYIVDDERYTDLLFILGYRGAMKNIQQYMPLHGFTNGYLINEYIRISYGGEHVKSNGRYTLSVEMSGKACREFERYSGHTWLDYFEFIYSQDFFKISRIDWAIDDFTGKEISLPYIRNLVEQGMYSSLTRKGNFYYSWEKKADTMYTAGFTINIGVKGGNQLRIYDKRHEQMSQGNQVQYDVWNRYELEMHDDKATEVLNHYYLILKQQKILDDAQYEKVLNKTSQDDQLTIDKEDGSRDTKEDDLKNFVRGLLFDFLDLKDPLDKNSRIRRKKTDPKWIDFLDSISKMKIAANANHVPSFDVKLKWINESLPTTFSELLIAKDIEGLLDKVYELVLSGFENLTPKKIARLNDYLLANGKERVTDKSLEDYANMIKCIREVNQEAIDELD